MEKQKKTNYRKLINSLILSEMGKLKDVASVSCEPGLLGRPNNFLKKTDNSIVIDKKSNGDLIITVSVNCFYNSSKSLPVQVLEIQESIKKVIEETTSFKVKYVNVIVVGVVFS